MMKLTISQQSVDSDVPRSTKSSTCSISSEVSSHNDEKQWQFTDDNSSHASSTWSSSTNRSPSPFSNPSKQKRASNAALPPPVLVYHESARSIVFRDNMHRAVNAAAEQVASIVVESVPNPAASNERHGRNGTRHASFLEPSSPLLESHPTRPKRAASVNLGEDFLDGPVLDGISNKRSSHAVDIKGFNPQIVPLPRLQLGRNDEFQPLLASDESQNEEYWTDREKEVYQMIMEQRGTIKTIKNSDWTPFLHRFKIPRDPPNGEEYRNKRDDVGPHHIEENENEPRISGDFPYNSFVTSTTLLPSGGIKMRAYGTNSSYTTGVVFSMPTFENTQLEQEAAQNTNTWSWPSGYSAKTEFNIDRRGELINGRAEALVPLSKLRSMNDDYVSKDEYVVGGRLVKGGLKTVPYNEVFLRVGGRGRAHLNGEFLTSHERSFEKGVGLPVAIFCRTASFGHLFSLLRTRARMLHTFGEAQMKDLPLLMITPDHSIRVLTERLQHTLLKVAAQHLNPFQNSLIAHKTKIDNTDPDHMQTKLEELIDLDDKMRETLTKEELVRIAGGFGATDDSVAKILRDAMIQDKLNSNQQAGDGEERHQLQDIVNEGLAASGKDTTRSLIFDMLIFDSLNSSKTFFFTVRAADYYTSRQLLILYSLVSSESHKIDVPKTALLGEEKSNEGNNSFDDESKSPADSKAMLLRYDSLEDPSVLSNVNNSPRPRPAPPPLDTDRLRSATNSDGLLAVLGAAQILKAMQDGGAKKRTKESWEAVEEWVEYGERNIAFRLASWRDQRAAQDDLEIAVNQDSSFMAFVSGKAISNRKKFALQLHQAVEQTDFNDMRFLLAIDEITNRMNSPCLRLELLQYVLGLDNRYSIAHVKRAVELAATCLNISFQNEQ